ncbi:MULTISPECIES: dienelactone hydrolase family protein [unclassified Parafrankia]|uniref:dienelactone hydrolase family protein n=1 Tax=unclassified Parafrankia TaxID=2994368 RepID=UPI0027D24E0C|nr:dienelactone hydrolase family protein [Parafrankia sp. BMG5.11]
MTEHTIRATDAIHGPSGPAGTSRCDIPLSQPEPTLELTRGISGELLFVIGEKDFLIDSDQVEKISSALRTAGVRHEVVVYPEVQHAFFWPDTPAFDQAARDDAMKRVLALLSR